MAVMTSSEGLVPLRYIFASSANSIDEKNSVDTTSVTKTKRRRLNLGRSVTSNTWEEGELVALFC